MTTAPFQPAEATSGDAYYDKYLVYGAADIRRLLQRLADGRCILSAHAEGDPEPLTTRVRRVDDHSFLAEPPSPPCVERWVGRRLQFEGGIDCIALRFRAGPVQIAAIDGEPMLVAPLPDRLLHMQRRAYMRREPPPGALLCRVPVPGTGVVAASIRDIGGGGLAVLAPEAAVPLSVGDVLPHCTIELPAIGAVEVTLRVRHLIASREVRQAGCEFVDLEEATRTKLLRYIMQLDEARSDRT